MYYYCDGKDDEDDEDDDDHIKFLDSFFYCPSTGTIWETANWNNLGPLIPSTPVRIGNSSGDGEDGEF